MSRAGRKAFERCDVKVVEFKDFVFNYDGDGNSAVLTDNPAEDHRTFAGNSTVLHCPRTEDDRVRIESQYSNHPNRITALRNVKKLAGELVCRDCMYSNMTPVQVSIARTEFAKVEAERLQAFGFLEQSRQEIEAHDARTTGQIGLPS